MKKLLLLTAILAFSVFAAPPKQPPSVIYDVYGLRPIDGDTVAFATPFMPPPLKKELHLRIYGVDTPEIGGLAACPKEAALGAQAALYTRNAVISAAHVQIALMDWDKYGGRVIGDLIVDGKSLRSMLITNGLAHEYYGGTRLSWCL